MKAPLESYSDEELSLIVMNDEFWYDMRHDADLWSWLRNHYTFTAEQEQDLRDTLEADLKETEDE